MTKKQNILYTDINILLSGKIKEFANSLRGEKRIQAPENQPPNIKEAGKTPQLPKTLGNRVLLSAGWGWAIYKSVLFITGILKVRARDAVKAQWVAPMNIVL